MSQRDAPRGVFRILDNGVKWKDLPRLFGSTIAVQRRFVMWETAVDEPDVRHGGHDLRVPVRQPAQPGEHTASLATDSGRAGD